MSLHTRIREARSKKGITQSELGGLIGVAKTTIAGYEKNREPTAAQLGEIADVLDVDVTFLLQDEIKKRHELYATPEEMENVIKKYRALDKRGKENVDAVLDLEYRHTIESEKEAASRQVVIENTMSYFYIPEYREPASAGTGQPIGADYPETITLIKEPPRGTSFIAHIHGDSMEPTFSDGDMIFVHAQNEIRKGQIGVFFMDGMEYIKEMGEDELISHNPKYDPIELVEGVRCQGLVLGVCDENYLEE